MKSINSKQEEQSSGQNSTEETTKEIYLNEEIERAKPLRIVGSTQHGYCIALGKYRVTPIEQTPYEAEAHLENNQWEIIINLIGAITGQTNELKDKMK